MHLGPSPAAVACLLFAIVSTLADTVTISVPAGLSLIGNPLNHPDGNTVDKLLPNPPEATQLYTRDPSGGTWQINQFQFGAWLKPGQVLNPGGGAIIRSPSAFILTFTGAVPATVTIPKTGVYSFVSWPLSTASEWGSVEGCSIFTFNSSHQELEQIAMGVGSDWYDPDFNPIPTPKPAPGKAFVYYDPTIGTSERRTIYIGNYAPDLSAPIYSTYSCIDTTLVAQLFYSTNSDAAHDAQFQPIGGIVPVVAHGAEGYLDPTADLLRELPYDHGTLQLRIWDSRSSVVFPGHGGFSRSEPLLFPPRFFPPANLNGLQPILVGPVTPFPSGNVSNQVVSLGNTAEFRAHEDLFGWNLAFAYRWQKSSDGVTWSDIPSATSKRLVIPAVGLSDAGWYRVILNAFGCSDFVTKPAKLTIVERPLLQGLTRSNDGQVRLSGPVSAAMPFQVERSTDLVHWLPLATVSNAALTWSVQDTNSASQQFYRLRVLP